MGEGRRGGGETRSEKRLSGLSLSVWWQSEPGMLATRDSGRSRPPHLSGTPWLSRWPSMPHPVPLLRTGADLTEDLLRRCSQPGPCFPLTQQHFTIPCTGMGFVGGGGAFAKEAKACHLGSWKVYTFVFSTSVALMAQTSHRVSPALKL